MTFKVRMGLKINDLLVLDDQGRLLTSAAKLTDSVILALSGDSSGFVDFDGSTGVTINVTHADTGVVPDTYTKVTVDSKGRVTEGFNPTPTIQLSGDVTGSAVFNGTDSINIVTTVGLDKVDLGTDTTGDYVKSVSTSDSHLTVTGTGEGAAVTIDTNATATDTANAIVARDASGMFGTSAIEFSLNASPVVPETMGRLQWDQAEGTLSLGMNGGDVVQNIGLETYYRVKNQSGVTLQNGSVVMATGALGNSGVVTVALADFSLMSSPQHIMGLITEDVVDGADGFVTHFGKVRGFDTTGSSVGEVWVDGDILYAHPTIVGRMTKNVPSVPHHKVLMAIVITAHTNGTVLVRPEYGSTFGVSDSNVSFTNPVDNQVVAYNGATGIWENRTPFTETDAIAYAIALG